MSYDSEGSYNKRMRTDGNYSTNIERFGDNPRRKEPEKPNHILLLTVVNPTYPINVEVIQSVCKLYGEVIRIVIFRKRGVQAMVEFNNIETAARAKEGLHGADIYSGCCTLRVEFGKADKLNVFKNGPDSWDFTMPEDRNGDRSRPALLGEAPSMSGRMGGRMDQMGEMGMSPMAGGRSSTDYYGDSFGMRDGRGMGGDRMRDMRGGGSGMGSGFMSSGMSATSQDSYNGAPVMMVYELNKDLMNCDRLFNLLCLYGNVIKIKFLKTKEGCAMVEMGDGLAVERAIANLNNQTFFDSKMTLALSKQTYLAEVQSPYELPDGTPSFKNTLGNKNNRFLNPDSAARNRILPPSKILHFFNTPPNVSQEGIRQVFVDKDLCAPKTVHLLPSKTDKSSRGLLEFNNVVEAMEALVACNHTPIENEEANSRFPFIMKLSFSSSRTIPMD
ncbi:unnamed protein product [Meganyctiphanes norvegica]|uniref:RRM domain-containing protein n=1 Tax=Meganyctiphanes norvegica TaxID=48144 RepID=A0AAV2RA19_MEGNR